jgi:hypothetical protein
MDEKRLDKKRLDEKRTDEKRIDEKRTAPRQRTLKAGSITFNRAGGIDCQVRNLSPVGACLEVASQIGIPDDFVLVIEHDASSSPAT